MTDIRDRSIFSHLLRPEYVLFGCRVVKATFQFRFVKKYKKPLSSDALSGFSFGHTGGELNQNVLEATHHLFGNTIPNFATKLCENVVTVNAKYLYSKRTHFTPFG